MSLVKLSHSRALGFLHQLQENQQLLKKQIDPREEGFGCSLAKSHKASTWISTSFVFPIGDKGNRIGPKRLEPRVDLSSLPQWIIATRDMSYAFPVLVGKYLSLDSLHSQFFLTESIPFSS